MDGKKISKKVEIDNLSHILRSWFGGVEIISYDIIYHPVYKVVYESKVERRTVRISGFSGDVM